MIDKLIKLIEKEGLDISSFFALYSMYKELDVPVYYGIVDMIKWEEDKLVKVTNIVPPKCELRQKAIDIIERIEKEFVVPVKSVNKGLDKDKINEVSSWIEEYRELFKDLKPGSMGDKQACKDKMIEFVKEYPEFADKDLILRAAQKYINNEAMNQNYKYLQKAHYFIYKKEDGKGGARISNLASFCEEVKDNVESKSTTTNVLDLN